MFARGRGGLRSGPGRNIAFKKAFDYLEEGKIREGVRALAAERANWLFSPDAFVRAARHYESAAQILIRHAVMTAKEFITYERGIAAEMAPVNVWIVAETAARIDIAGTPAHTHPCRVTVKLLGMHTEKK